MDTVVLPVLLRLHREQAGLERFSPEWNRRLGAMATIVDMISRDFDDMYLLTVMRKFKDQTGENMPLDISHVKRLLGLGVRIKEVQCIIRCNKSSAAHMPAA
jgi:hypothetical protein